MTGREKGFAGEENFLKEGSLPPHPHPFKNLLGKGEWIEDIACLYEQYRICNRNDF